MADGRLKFTVPRRGAAIVDRKHRVAVLNYQLMEQAFLVCADPLIAHHLRRRTAVDIHNQRYLSARHSLRWEKQMTIQLSAIFSLEFKGFGSNKTEVVHAPRIPERLAWSSSCGARC